MTFQAMLVMWCLALPWCAPAPSTSPLELELPMRLGPWVRSAAVARPTGAPRASDVVQCSAFYRRDGHAAVEVLVTREGSGRRGLHGPENCLAADGWNVTQRALEARLGGTVVTLSLRRGDLQMSAAYAYRVGDVVTANRWRYLAAAAWARLTGSKVDAELVTVAAASENGRTAAPTDVLVAFLDGSR